LIPNNSSNSNHLKVRERVSLKRAKMVKVRSQTEKVAAKTIRIIRRVIAPKAMNLQPKMRAKTREKANLMIMISREPKKKEVIYVHAF
jgi:hypothetical protein